MRILITTGLSKADIGGPFQYALNLEKEFKKLGHEVKVASYGPVERALPPWIRHLYFLIRILANVIWSDKVLTLDTYSVGIPTVMAAKVMGKKVIARVGGDFLWSAYVNRTGEPVTLPAFYASMPRLIFKEKLIFFFMSNMIRNTDHLAFNTEWQRGVWQSFYKMKDGQSGVVRNFIPEKRESAMSHANNILWAGRAIPEKNLDTLEKAGERAAQRHSGFKLDIVTGEPHEKILERVKNCRAAVSVAFTDISPNFIIEAISFNKPFILTKETGLNELYPKGGIFVDPLDDTEIERAIEAMLDDKTYNGYVEELKSIDITHSWNKLAQEFIDIWEKI